MKTKRSYVVVVELEVYASSNEDAFAVVSDVLSKADSGQLVDYALMECYEGVVG